MRDSEEATKAKNQGFYKHWRWLLGIAVICALLAPMLMRQNISTPVSIQASSVTNGQEEFARELYLGIIYANVGLSDKAVEAYEKAALASQPDIALAARVNITDIINQQRDPWDGVKSGLRWFAGLGLGFLLLPPLWKMFTRKTRQDGYLLTAFEDHTKEQVGSGSHLLLESMLHEIVNVHRRANANLVGFAKLQSLQIPIMTAFVQSSEPLEQVLASLETVSVGPFGVSLSKLYEGLRLPFTGHKYIISGHWFDVPQGARLYVQIRDSQTYELLETWNLNGPASDLIIELAFRLIEHLGNPDGQQVVLGARNWRSLQAYTFGMLDLQDDSGSNQPDMCQKAIVHFLDALRSDPGNSIAQYALGIAYMRAYDFKNARSFFAQVRDSESMLVLPARYHLGLSLSCEFYKNALEEALEQYGIVVKALAPNGVLRDGASESDRMLLSATYCGMANALAQALKSSDAKEKINASQKLVEQYCKQALQTLNENRQGSSAYQSVLALSENALGITAYYANQIEAARKHLRKSIGIYPDNALGYGYLALLCLKTDDELQALRWLEESLAWGIRQPHIDYLYYQFGQYHHKNGNLAKAQEYYRKATESAVSWNALGELFAEQESKREAIECFQKAVKLNSRTMRFWANLADQIALTFNDEASLQEAYTAADRALNLENNWYTRNIRGVVLFKQGKFEKAEKDILESIKKSPRLLNHYHLALLNEKRGNTKRALELLEIALSLKNNRDEVSWVQQAAKLRTELQQRSAAARI